MTRIRALLVGIDKYMAVQHLAGCVADVNAFRAVLSRRVAPADLSIEVLLDEQATRTAIIDAFRRHLGAATSGEVALFYFAGHGSQEPCPAQWARSEADELNETLVCVDSRTPGIWDIADKELNALIAEAGSAGAHVVTIFDSCHSGGVTREIRNDIPSSVRMTPGVHSVRPTTAYLDAARERYDLAAVENTGTPEPPHLALSACQPHQTAKEMPVSGMHRGVFTVALEESLGLLGEGATYVDLATAVRASLRARVEDQAPDLYAAGGASSSTPFLGGAVQPRSLTVNHEGDDWWLSAGAVDGFTDPCAGGTVELDLFDRDAPPNEGGAPIATATVDAVEPSRSKLHVAARVEHELDDTRQYVAVITAIGTASLRIVVSGTDAAVVEAASAADPSVVITTDPPTAGSDVRTIMLEVGDGSLRFSEAAGASIVRPFEPNGDDLGRLRGDIAHLAKWHSLLDRIAPGSRIGDAVALELLAVARGQQTADDEQRAIPVVDQQLTLAYDGDDPPRVLARLTNGSDRRFFAALFDLTDSYGSAKLFADWVEPRSTAWVGGGRVQTLTIPDWMSAAREANDRLKLIVSTESFDADAWTMARLLGPSTRSTDRDMGDANPADPVSDDGWGTSLLNVRTTRA